ncbi:MAG: amidohydrolase family protein, partial [Candidatus Syntrophosphaera sp.]
MKAMNAMNAPQPADILITGGTILCLDEGLNVLENHSIAVRNGKIADIFPAGGRHYSARQSIDAAGCIVMPGLINAHTHLPMTYFRGLADDLPLKAWLEDYIWPLESRLLDKDFVRKASLHGAAEMIKNGITQIHDMYFHMASVADACTQAGLRAIIGEAVIDGNANSGSSPGGKVVDLRRAYRNNPLVDFDLSPHSIYACSRQTLQKCARVAADEGILLHMHLTEARHEVGD